MWSSWPVTSTCADRWAPRQVLLSPLTLSLMSSLPCSVNLNSSRAPTMTGPATPSRQPLPGFPHRIPCRLPHWPLPAASACRVTDSASPPLPAQVLPTPSPHLPRHAGVRLEGQR
jgi:hypothetical protein